MNTRELVDRLAAGGQEALDRASSELASNPVTAAALQRALEAKERVDALGVSALGQLHLPTAEAVEEVASKVRAVATRLERVEGVLGEISERLERIEARLAGPSTTVLPTGSTGTADPGPLRGD
jgi:hypothetical protein